MGITARFFYENISMDVERPIVHSSLFVYMWRDALKFYIAMIISDTI